MRPVSPGIYRWAAAGLFTLGAADLLAINLAVAPKWLAERNGSATLPAIASAPPLTPPPAIPRAAPAPSPLAPSKASAVVALATSPSPSPPPVAASALAPASATATPSAFVAVATPPIEAAPPARSVELPAPSAAPGAFARHGAITFPTGSAALTDEGRSQLQQNAQQLRARHKLHVRLEGHADGNGKAELNQWLSVERAKAARAYLALLGVDISRVEAAGFGAERPADPSCNETSCPANRRVEILLQERP